jgi:hypothetical protein
MRISFYAFLLLASLPASADSGGSPETTCSGRLLVRGENLQGRCTGSHCSGHTRYEQVSGNGTCDGDSVQVHGYRNGAYLNGSCSGGSVHFFLSRSSIRLMGNCSDGRIFEGEARSNGKVIYGRCRENSTFSVLVHDEWVAFQGTCR